MLSGEPLKIRLKHLNTIPLEKVQDVCFVFSKCDQGDEVISATILSGNVQGVMNDPRGLAKMFLESPQKLIPEFNNLHCDNGHLAHPIETILCRVNPQKGTDLHLITNSLSKTIELALLLPNGDYTLIPEETRKKLLGV